MTDAAENREIGNPSHVSDGSENTENSESTKKSAMCDVSWERQLFHGEASAWFRSPLGSRRRP